MQGRKMIEQNNSATNQVTRRHPRVVVYLKTEHKLTHEDLANLHDDEGVALLERRCGRPIFNEKDGVMSVYIMMLTLFGGKPLLLEKSGETRRERMMGILSKPISELKRLIVFKFRDLLRQAWRGETNALADVQSLAKADTHFTIGQNGQIELVVENPLAKACILFLHDFGAGRLAFCANPNCTDPFFVRSRSTQKFCDRDACMVYSHRLSANKYWSNHRKKKQAKEKGARR